MKDYVNVTPAKTEKTYKGAALLLAVYGAAFGSLFYAAFRFPV